MRQASSEAGLSLDPNLNGLEGAESNVGNKLGGCGARKIYERLVSSRILRTCNVGVVLLEEFVESELASSLCTVTKQGGAHPLKKPLAPCSLSRTPKPELMLLYFAGSI